MNKFRLETTREQTSKRLTAFIVAVVFVMGTLFVPTGTLAAETEEEETAANAPMEDLVVVHDENGSAAALEDLGESEFDGFIYKLREDVTKKEVKEMETAIDEIESQLQNSFEREVTSVQIGEMALEKMKDIDEIAYVRFASVYHDFKDIQSFLDELNKLKSEK